MRLIERLQIVGGEHQPLASEGVCRGELGAQLLVGDRRLQRAQCDGLELLGLVASVFDDRDVGLAAQPQPGAVDLLGERDVGEQPLLAFGVGPVRFRQHPCRRPLHRVDLGRHLRNLRNKLRRSRTRAQDRHSGPAEIHGVIPACGVHHGSGERLLLHEIRHHRLGEDPDRGHHDVEGVLLAVCRAQHPCSRRGLPSGRDDLGAQLQVCFELMALCALFEVLQDLLLPGPQSRPARVEVERVRVQMRFHVARQTRIGVDPPGAADAVFAVEDGEVREPGFAQEDPQRQAARSGADDSHGQRLRH